MRLGKRFIIFALAALSATSMGQIVQLSNDGSTAQINAGTGSGGNLGLFDWRIGNGPNNVVQQVYAIRIGTGAVTVVNNISAPIINQPTSDLASITYVSGANSYDITFRYLLTGGAPNSSDIAEVATLFNRGNGPLTFSLYEYDFFSPGGATGGTGTLLNSSTIEHVKNGASVTVGATRIPDRWMIDTAPNVVNAILAGNLANASSPFSNPDSLAFAFQWNVTVGAGQSWQMSKDKLLSVPEPASLLTLGGLVAIAVRRRRKVQ